MKDETPLRSIEEIFRRHQERMEAHQRAVKGWKEDFRQKEEDEKQQRALDTALRKQKEAELLASFLASHDKRVRRRHRRKFGRQAHPR